MSVRRVLKWAVPIDDEWHEIGPGRVVHVGQQPGSVDVQVWTEEDLRGELPRRARVFGTGQPLPSEATHVGSVIASPFVWHVYEDRS